MIDTTVKKLIHAYEQRLLRARVCMQVVMEHEKALIDLMEKTLAETAGEQCPHCKERYPDDENTIAIQDDGACLNCQAKATEPKYE